MQGTILNFDTTAGTGVLRAEDAKRYRFAADDWASPGVALPGDVVDFEPEEGRATEIFVTSRVAEAVAQLASEQLNPPLKSPEFDSQPEVQNTAAAPVVATGNAPSIQMPSGLGARFFIAYAVTLIPTYVLPYFGSNSLLVNGLASDMGGFPVQFWWHISCYAVLIFLAFVRGVRISRIWLAAFPVLAAIFDLMPVINNIPLAPTLFNAAALYVGSSRSAPPGYVPENLNKKIEFGLWGIAAFSVYAIYKIWTSPFSAGSGFAGSLLLWPVLGLAAFFALKYRAGEGGSIIEELSAKFGGMATTTGIAFAAKEEALTIEQSADPTDAADTTAGLSGAAAAHYCSECGSGNEAQAVFCGECGAGL